MAKKVCELCGINQSSDMLFGVALCDECRRIHSGISQGDPQIINNVLNPVFFANSTANAKTMFSNAIQKYNLNKDKIETQKREKEEISKNYANLMLTTGTNFDGYIVKDYIDILCEEVVFKNSFWKRLDATLEDLGNAFTFKDTELSGANKLISNAREYVVEKFKQKAAQLGANAVLGVEFESSFGSDIVRVSVSGTAVRIEKIDNTNNSLDF